MSQSNSPGGQLADLFEELGSGASHAEIVARF
jgi:hypothetical protein